VIDIIPELAERNHAKLAAITKAIRDAL